MNSDLRPLPVWCQGEPAHQISGSVVIKFQKVIARAHINATKPIVLPGPLSVINNTDNHSKH